MAEFKHVDSELGELGQDYVNTCSVIYSTFLMMMLVLAVMFLPCAVLLLQWLVCCYACDSNTTKQCIMA
jgi:hypothetical protein